MEEPRACPSSSVFEFSRNSTRNLKVARVDGGQLLIQPIHRIPIEPGQHCAPNMENNQQTNALDEIDGPDLLWALTIPATCRTPTVDLPNAV